MSDEVRTYLTNCQVGHIFTIRLVSTRCNNAKANYSGQTKALIKHGFVEDLTPEKLRCKTYKYILPLHGYAPIASAKYIVTVEVNSIDNLDSLIKQYKVLSIQGGEK